jgi:hypothetical protein
MALLPCCTYKFHSWGNELELIQTLESGDKVLVKMKDGDNYRLKFIEVDQFALRGTDNQKQIVELPITEVNVVQKLQADSKSLIAVGVCVTLVGVLLIWMTGSECGWLCL